MPMLAEFLAQSARDRSVRGVVLTGARRAYCAGGDVKGMAAGRDAVLNARAE
jgi:enoyl-CoA hydratase/carnithine racemase